MRWLDSLKAKAKELKAEGKALYHAARHPQTPWYAKAIVVAIAAYVLSPIDLIPDFIPVLGYLDEVILVPIAIRWAIKLIPAHVMEESRKRATSE